MNVEEKIKDLIKSTSSTNHLLAINLMQSQYIWSLEESLKFLFPIIWRAYGRFSLDQWVYSIGQFDLKFSLEINDENIYSVFNWDLYLILSLKANKKLLFKDSYFVGEVQKASTGQDIKDLKQEVQTLFDQALPSISTHLKSMSND